MAFAQIPEVEKRFFPMLLACLIGLLITACGGGGGEEEATCEDGERRCQGEIAERCAGGQWQEEENCGESDRICQDGACVGDADGDNDRDSETDPESPCRTGDAICVESVVHVCDAGQFTPDQDCDEIGRRCENGRCVEPPDGDEGDIDPIDESDDADGDMPTDGDEPPDGDDDHAESDGDEAEEEEDLACNCVSEECCSDGCFMDPDGTPCIEDIEFCTADYCEAGVCLHIETTEEAECAGFECGLSGNGCFFCGQCDQGQICFPDNQCDLPSRGFCSNAGGLEPMAPWPMRGFCPTRRGVSTHYGPETNQFAWTYNANALSVSSPAVGVDGTVYVGSNVSRAYAVNPNGQKKWEFDATGDILSSPAIAADHSIVVGSLDRKVYAIRAIGSRKWSYTTGGEIRTSPAIGPDGAVYVAAADSKLYAINEDGAFRWEAEFEGLGTSPAIGADGTVYLGSSAGSLYAFDATGGEKWTFPVGSPIESAPTVAPDGTIYFGSDDKNLYAINPDGTKKWDYATRAAIKSSAAIGSDGTIYIGSNDKNLHAVRPSGERKWTFTVGGEIVSQPAIDRGGTIYFGAKDKRVYAITLAGARKWDYLTGGEILTTPAIGVDGRLYVAAADNKLYAFGGSTPTIDVAAIEGGTFKMGCRLEQSDCDVDFFAEREVTLTYSFLMQSVEVTQGQFQELMGYNPSFNFFCGTSCPVENVSWHEAAAYANARSVGDGLTACFDCTGSGSALQCLPKPEFVPPQSCLGWRLPTEAEWELACRAGTDTAHYNGEIQVLDNQSLDPGLDPIAWYERNSLSVSHQGGLKTASPYGLFDMVGNVFEWVLDTPALVPSGEQTDPLIFDPAEPRRLARGGDYLELGTRSTCYHKSAQLADSPRFSTGFRVVRTIIVSEPGR
ncbi:MAG: hypothetical protein C4523_11205 [Myxococcales bacterium]|nr:MAG: hypothetical protein C4523_11205 [Myxococcales bacterium]